MNLATAKTKTFMLIDLHSRSGVLLDQGGTKQKDYTLKMPYFFDIAQKKVAQVKKIVKSMRFSHVMPVNLLGMSLYQFDIVQNIGADQIYEATDVGGYYFEVDDVCQIIIREDVAGVWTTISTINHVANPGKFTAYKGRLDTENKVQIVFKGGTLYNHRNRAMFRDRFSADDRVPTYQKYVPYTMPDDFYQLNKVVLKGQLTNSQQYEQTADFFWEERNIIVINWHIVAEYSIEYFAYPSDINSETLDSYEFEVDTEAQEAIPYYAAAQALLIENNVAGDRLMNEFNTIMANLNPKISQGANFVSNSLFQSAAGTNKLF